MSFLAISLLVMVTWGLTYRRWKLLSISFTNLTATLLFIGMGMESVRVTPGAEPSPYEDPLLSVAVVSVFYAFLVVGERIGRRVSIHEHSLGRLGQDLLNQPVVQISCLVLFVGYALLPMLGVLASGKSVDQLFVGTWATDGVAARSQAWIEQSQRSLVGTEALLVGIQGQLAGFWYLSIGVVFATRRTLSYPFLMIYAAGLFLTSGGSRTEPLIAALIPAVLWVLSPRTNKLRTIALIAVLGVGTLVSLDSLVQGRQGSTAEGGVMERIERTLRTDFAYGGLGLELGKRAPEASVVRGLGYLGRMVVQPVPRVVWAEKPTSDPNREMTEWYTGMTLEEFGSVWLFTPLGEALFYFGFLGLAVIPLLYGLTTTVLERVYRSSAAYMGLLVQTYIWALVGMRLTYFNLFSALIAANFALLAVLVIASRVRLSARASAPIVVAYKA